MSKIAHRNIPFPGTRCFDATDSEFFFGRSVEIEALKAKIRKERFVAMVGHPNVGKSSLVQGGLKVALKNKFSAKSGANWMVVELNAKKDLFKDLCDKLTSRENGTIDRTIRLSPKYKKNIIETLSDKKDKGLVNIYKNSNYMKKHNLLIVIDHFEEVLKNIAERPNFKKIINLLRNGVLDKSTSIYVLFVMHKETYDTINRGKSYNYVMLKNMIRYPFYLHGMTESGLQEAIIKPIEKLNYRIQNDLCKELITDVITLKTEHQLPTLQTNLITIWENWKEDITEDVISIKHYKSKGKKAEPKPKRPQIITFATPTKEKEKPKPKPVVRLGTIAKELYAKSLNFSQREACKVIFQTILGPKKGNSFTAKPATIKELVAISNEGESMIIAVIRLFATKKILSYSPSGELSGLSKIKPVSGFLNNDWENLPKWMEEEQGRVDYFHYLVGEAMTNSNMNAVEKEDAKDWWLANNKLEWVLRYGSQEDYNAVEVFFEEQSIVIPIAKPRIEQPMVHPKSQRKKITIRRK